jgi:hypothetical protein
MITSVRPTPRIRFVDRAGVEIDRREHREERDEPRQDAEEPQGATAADAAAKVGHGGSLFALC